MGLSTASDGINESSVRRTIVARNKLVYGEPDTEKRIVRDVGGLVRIVAFPTSANGWLREQGER